MVSVQHLTVSLPPKTMSSASCNEIFSRNVSNWIMDDHMFEAVYSEMESFFSVCLCCVCLFRRNQFHALRTKCESQFFTLHSSVLANSREVTRRGAHNNRVNNVLITSINALCNSLCRIPFVGSLSCFVYRFVVMRRRSLST